MTAGKSDNSHNPGTSKSVELHIKKATIVANITLTFEAEEHENGTINKLKKECGHPIHDDLRTAMEKLKVHLALLCELIEYTDIKDIDRPEHPILEKLSIKGISMGGDDDHEGVTIIGSRRLRGNKVLNLISPFQKFNDDTPESYAHDTDLYAKVADVINEIELYIDGKYGEGAQLEMSFEGDDLHGM